MGKLRAGAPGQLDHPTAVAVDTQGNVYVAEYWAHRVQKLSRRPANRSRCGATEATNPGQLLWPRDLALDSAGNVYVADSGNNRIQKFSPSGQSLLQWEINADPTRPGDRAGRADLRRYRCRGERLRHQL